MSDTTMIHIRPGRLSDLPQIEIIERETALMFPPSVLPLHLAQPLVREVLVAGIRSSLLWVAQGNCAGPVGFVLCEGIDACLHIAEMDVRPSFGRNGIGARLLAQVCPAAARSGLDFVTLTTFRHLPWNAPFYARHGFAVMQDLEQFPHLRAALHDESSRGLDHRVAMVKRMAGAAP